MNVDEANRAVSRLYHVSMSVTPEYVRPPDWREEALCTQTDPEIFFPDIEKGAAVLKAKGVCTACPVQPECLAWAMRQPDLDGVFGGMTTKERRKFRRTA